MNFAFRAVFLVLDLHRPGESAPPKPRLSPLPSRFDIGGASMTKAVTLPLEPTAVSLNARHLDEKP